MVTLRVMSDAEYETFYTWMVEDYAGEIAKNYALSLQDARQRSQGQLSGLLPEGRATAGQLLVMIVPAGDAEPVGCLWVHTDTDRRRAFIYNIVVYDQHQGQGYGSSALSALEGVLHQMGIERIGLHVFGSNTRAQALYTKLGYRVTGMDMQKEIGGRKNP